MQHSSKQNPCPVCGRNSDDKCRWNDSSILCYCGDSFRPPKSLNLGETIKVLGVNWRLISFYSGFANASYLFAKTDNFYYLSPLEKHRRKTEIRDEAKEKIAEYRKKFILVRQLLHKSLNIKEIQFLTIREISDGQKLTELAIAECSKLISMLVEYKALITIKKNHIFALKYWEKTLRYQLTDIENFQNLYLSPSSKLPILTEQEDCWF